MTGNEHKQKLERKTRRHARIRSRVQGTRARPRLSVFRSHAHMYVQLIDDGAGATLAAVSDTGKKELSGKERGTKMKSARLLGLAIAKIAQQAGIKQAVFDAGGNKYHGRTQEVAEGAREGGLKF